MYTDMCNKVTPEYPMYICTLIFAIRVRLRVGCPFTHAHNLGSKLNHKKIIMFLIHPLATAVQTKAMYFVIVLSNFENGVEC